MFCRKSHNSHWRKVGHPQDRPALRVLMHNPALDLAPLGRWTLRDETAQRQSAPRSAFSVE